MNQVKHVNEALGLMIYRDQKLISEAYHLNNTKFAWLPWSEQNKFKVIAQQLAQDLLKDLKPQNYTIIRSEILTKYQVHLLLTEQNLAYILFITQTPIGSPIPIPIHLVFECFTNQNSDNSPSAQLILNQINQRLKEWHNNLDPLNKIKSDLETTRQQMIGNITKIIERQDTLEDLLEKSQKLQKSAGQFKKQSQRLNSCCYIL